MPDNFPIANISWLFTKEYYNHKDLGSGRPFISFDYVPIVNKPANAVNEADRKKIANIKNENAKTFEQKSKWLCNKKWSNYNSQAVLLQNNSFIIAPNIKFELTVENPGLLFGIGVTHESGNDKEFKIGFFFDHATGLVVIPGHAVKGTLRSWFKNKELRDCLLHHLCKEDLIQTGDELKMLGHKLDEPFLKQLEMEMFEGKDINKKHINLYDKDIFHDAFIINSLHTGDVFLGEDALAPHGEDHLKNPIPLPFIKLLPNTVLQFNFCFNDGVVSKCHKEQIVKYLVKEYGIGAKTNLGYGQFKQS